MARTKKAENKVKETTEMSEFHEEMECMDEEEAGSFYDFYEPTEEEIADGRRKETCYTRWPEGTEDLGIVQFKGPWGQDVKMGRIGLTLVIDWNNNVKLEINELAPTKRYHKTGVLHDETSITFDLD